MMKQLSLFAQNNKGTLQDITGILKNEQINILGSVTNDSAEYGIIRMVVSAPEKAALALENAGYLCRLTDVALSESNINVDYVYLSFNRDSGKPILIFHTEDTYEVEACLAAKGFTVV